MLYYLLFPLVSLDIAPSALQVSADLASGLPSLSWTQGLQRRCVTAVSVSTSVDRELKINSPPSSLHLVYLFVFNLV